MGARDTVMWLGQQIPYFDSCQLTIIWMSIIKLNTGYRLPNWQESLTFHIGFPVVWTDGHMVTLLPKFLRWIDDQIFLSISRVRTLFWTKTSRTLQGLSRTHFAFFKDSIQCKKEIWVYVFFSSTTTWAILSWRSFILGTWESGLDKVSTEIQGLSSTDYNFQGLSRPWTFYFKFQGLSRTFKVRANPV